MSAIESELGIDMLEIEPGGDGGAGPRVTVGEEIAPGLVARFSRQFGQDALRRGDDRILPVAHLPASRDVFGCAIVERAVAVPPRRAGRDRPAAVLQLLMVVALVLIPRLFSRSHEEERREPS